tara:strand:+ start:35315 stop:35779 length:465 start_codon:yes stop_codon:yes gene_type:complete
MLRFNALNARLSLIEDINRLAWVISDDGPEVTEHEEETAYSFTIKREILPETIKSFHERNVRISMVGRKCIMVVAKYKNPERMVPAQTDSDDAVEFVKVTTEDGEELGVRVNGVTYIYYKGDAVRCAGTEYEAEPALKSEFGHTIHPLWWEKDE